MKRKRKEVWVCAAETLINAWILSRYNARTQSSSKTKQKNQLSLYLAKLSLNIKIIYFSDKCKLLMILYVHTKEKIKLKGIEPKLIKMINNNNKIIYSALVIM